MLSAISLQCCVAGEGQMRSAFATQIIFAASSDFFMSLTREKRASDWSLMLESRAVCKNLPPLNSLPEPSGPRANNAGRLHNMLKSILHKEPSEALASVMLINSETSDQHDGYWWAYPLDSRFGASACST